MSETWTVEVLFTNSDGYDYTESTIYGLFGSQEHARAAAAAWEREVNGARSEFHPRHITCLAVRLRPADEAVPDWTDDSPEIPGGDT